VALRNLRDDLHSITLHKKHFIYMRRTICMSSFAGVHVDVYGRGEELSEKNMHQEKKWRERHGLRLQSRETETCERCHLSSRDGRSSFDDAAGVNYRD